MQRVRLMLLLVVVLLVGLSAGPALAQDDGEDDEPATEEIDTGLGGTAAVGDEPLENVAISVTTEDGDEVADTVTDADGQWFVEIEEPGRYEVTLDAESLPEGVELRDPDRDSLTVSVRMGRTTQALFRLVGEDAEGLTGRGLAGRIAQASVNGVKFGLIIAMTAIGLSLIFGTTGLVNFAHAEMVTFGAVVAWFLNTGSPQLHLLYAAPLAIAAGALLGAGLERGMFRPLRGRRTGRFQLLVISIGLGIILRQALLIWFGPNSRPYGNFRIQQVLSFGPISVAPRDLAIIGISLVVLVLVALLLQRTRMGKAMRAVSDNVDLAESSGIDVRRIILFVWALGGGLAAFGGVLQATTTSVNYLMGFQLLLLMFAGVILGGLGTAYGAMVGSLVVGLTTEVSTVWLSAELKYVWALGVLILVLLFRPQGILGTTQRVG
jgi:neutral amino acid transport system permease protein